MKAIKVQFVILVAVCIGFAMASTVRAGELHAAAGQGNLYKVKTLLGKGKKVDEKDEHGLTPLHYAAAAAKLDIVKYLVTRRANLDSQDQRGKTPLHYACAADMNIPFGGQQFGSMGFDMFMVDGIFTDIVEFLLSKRASPNIADKDGLTPLHEIAGSGTQGISAEKRAKVLLAAGADRTLKDKKGRTPCDLAVEKQNQSIADILAEAQEEQQFTESDSAGTTSSESGKNIDSNRSDPAVLKGIISDYLTLMVWIINRDKFSTADVWKTGRSLLDKHHFEGAKARGTVAVPESFEAVLISSGLIALKFHAVWVDPLPILIDSRGDFPPIQVRNGSVSPIDDRVRLRIDIGDRTEVMVDGVGYVHEGGQWNEVK
jgi:hypothetical protein